jgi:GGDEF domain-containing protein
MAWIAAERFRALVEAMETNWVPPLPKVTISLGIFTFGDVKISAEDAIKRAEEALFFSKRSGRNCSSVWKSGLFKKINRMKEDE